MSYFWSDGVPIRVQTDAQATPKVLVWQGKRHAVQQVAKRWRVDQDWWHQHVWREYFKVITRSGLLLIIYRDVLSGQWYLQRLYN